MTQQHQGYLRERMTILGDLEVTSFVPWIQRYAAKLGLSETISYASADRIEIELDGPEELIDMMEIGCTLGPINVWVEIIERRPVAAENR
nr:acylphosphatase [Rhizobium herbae]